MRTTFSFIHFSGFFGNFAFVFWESSVCAFLFNFDFCGFVFFLLGILLTWRQVHQTRLIRSPPASSGNWLGYQPLNLNPNPNLWGFLAKSESLVIWMPKASHAALFTFAVGLSGFKKQFMMSAHNKFMTGGGSTIPTRNQTPTHRPFDARLSGLKCQTNLGKTPH